MVRLKIWKSRALQQWVSYCPGRIRLFGSWEDAFDDAAQYLSKIGN